MYNFKKNAKAYIVTSNGTHRIDLYSDITASQTFDEQGYKRKTLHNLNDLHDHAVLNNANPANFSFTTPIPNSDYDPVVLRLGSNYSSGTIESFDLYIQSDNIIYVLTTCAIESMAFNIEMKAPLTVSVSGTASKLSKFGNVGPARIPGIDTAESNFSRTYSTVDRLSVSIANTTLDSIASVHMDLKNDINWNGYKTINDAVKNRMMYPNSYVLGGRTLSGSITQFITSQNSNSLFDTSTSSSVNIGIYCLDYSSTNTLLRFTLPSVVFTRRLNFEELINRVYDFRLNSNSTIVEPIYKTTATATSMDFRVPANSGLIALIN